MAYIFMAYKWKLPTYESWDDLPTWEAEGTPPMPRPPQEIAGLIEDLLTIGFP